VKFFADDGGSDDDEWRVFVIFGRRPYLYGSSAPMPSNELAQFAGALVLSACTLFAFSQVPRIKK